ncbi:flagellar basal body P-ring protein FlgI [Adhaeretor mobilis]|uniref:Flagellar P-ring protein n=1 Tax=Adhaeretor mobilis TaxID=1930276 RepID=A0A517MTV7_9BACT|nr:flagellar basal body P-ring protein FlgI [Adhaeretor mobilis]QDS98318.1 Flagellar P-ring protein precursor [Adhaeretor mobilis]
MSKKSSLVALCIALLSLSFFTEQVEARTALRNICRVKGQEENVLRGLGLVTGLNGTGDAADPATMRALARAMEIMGSPVPEVALTANGKSDLSKIKNVAIVMVTATVPATGARSGDKLDCHLSAISGKSLAGGHLAFAALQGPNTRDRRVYALCGGDIQLDDAAQPLVGRIHNGCQMEADVFTPFKQDGYITLILDRHHANFQTATEVVESVRRSFSDENEEMAQAVNAANIVVQIPVQYRTEPVTFLADLLDINVYSPEPEARVVINARTGSIVISGDVTIGEVVVSHKNVVIEVTEQARFEAIGDEQAPNTRLDALVTALDSLKVPAEDVIDIITGIERNGKLHGQLIMQ